ncbi:MAG: hypothetical protein HY336_01900 [Candidatus Doudnabacteria bacterium]|nr:hypothetical protein [Candidatus Doudnabacteria bacterium]
MNLTSVKHKLKVKNYIRYADDFVILSKERNELVSLIDKITKFLKDELDLTLHPYKINISNFALGVDFLGWVNFSKHRVLRTTTKKHMLRRIGEHPTAEMLQSYLGLLQLGNTNKIKQDLVSKYWYLNTRKLEL